MAGSEFSGHCLPLPVAECQWHTGNFLRLGGDSHSTRVRHPTITGADYQALVVSGAGFRAIIQAPIIIQGARVTVSGPESLSPPETPL